jgi:hypothetical protein
MLRRRLAGPGGRTPGRHRHRHRHGNGNGNGGIGIGIDSNSNSNSDGWTEPGRAGPEMDPYTERLTQSRGRAAPPLVANL